MKTVILSLLILLSVCAHAQDKWHTPTMGPTRSTYHNVSHDDTPSLDHYIAISKRFEGGSVKTKPSNEVIKEWTFVRNDSIFNLMICHYRTVSSEDVVEDVPYVARLFYDRKLIKVIY